MIDYYTLFVDLSLRQCTKNDYSDKSKVHAHNEASEKLRKLKKEMEQLDCADTLSALLSHRDDRVRINAVSLCLQMNILIDKAIPVLENIAVFSDDPSMRFSAKMILQNTK